MNRSWGSCSLIICVLCERALTLVSHGDHRRMRQTPPDPDPVRSDAPGTDGLTLCREIRRFSDIPIVMVTAKNRRDRSSCWGWRLAQMIISVAVRCWLEGSASKPFYAVANLAAMLQQTVMLKVC